MGVLDRVKGMVSGVKTAVKKHEAKKKREATALRAKRSKSAPVISKIAKEYNADVDILDRAAYVHKIVKGQERGAHIPYGSEPDTIRAKLDKAFIGSTTISKIAHGIKIVKQTRDELKKAGIQGGSMYGDPKDMFRMR